MSIHDTRLAKKRDFDLLLRYGKTERGTNVDVRALALAKIQNYWPKKEINTNFGFQLRYAVSAGLKLSKKAVVRNRIKRRVRAALTEIFKKTSPASGFYFLVLPKAKVETIVFAELKQELELLLRAHKII